MSNSQDSVLKRGASDRIKWYELSENQWTRIAPLPPGKARDPGRTGSNNRLFVNRCLWALRSGAH
jgi:transposase